MAGFSPDQLASYGAANGIAGAVTPDLQLAGGALANYTTAGAGSVNPSTIASKMSPYMNQYVMQALQPQIQQQDLQFANQNKGVDAAATSAGAFGDTGWGQLRGTTTQAQDAARGGLIGAAYNTAFNTAIGAGAQDVSNDINAQTTNQNLREASLARQLGGATSILGANTGAANLTNQFGAQQTAQTQAGLNAQYNQWLMAQQYPFQTLGAMDQAIGASGAAVPKTTTSTTSAPNNSGYGMIGSVLGGIGGSFIGMPGLGASLGGAVGGAVGNGLMSSGAVNPTAYTNGAGLPYAADGGKFKKGKPVIVGERGPEVFIPGKDGVVVPNEVMEAARDKRKAKTGSRDGLSKQLGIAA